MGCGGVKLGWELILGQNFRSPPLNCLLYFFQSRDTARARATSAKLTRPPTVTARVRGVSV